jgi:rfaE bifunctional protein nucleotidyltransferase chain/domain
MKPRNGFHAWGDRILNKIFAFDEIGAISARMKRTGKVIVHAHGTFDMLHVGHVKYLQHAKSLGDLLVVTLTADKFVNKGPNRPVFPEGLRAEMIAALECVDYVVIVSSPSGVKAISEIRPDFYIKGQDYRNPEGDITGKIMLEREMTRMMGGKFVIADTEQYSSTELINRYVNIYEPDLKVYLDRVREQNGLEYMLGMLEAIGYKKIAVIGESIIDEYQYVIPVGKSAKENMICTRYQDHEIFNGGIDMVVQMLRGLGADVKRITWNRQINKTRFVDPAYMRKLFEVCHINDDPILLDEELALNAALDDAGLGGFDLVIVVDYGHGMFSPAIIKRITSESRFLAVNIQTNSNNFGFNLAHKYPKADFICIDMPEARLAVGDKHAAVDDVIRKLADKIDCQYFIVTNGKYGCVTYDKKNGVLHTIPSVAKSVTDTMGAGDAFLAITSPLVESGYALDRVGFVGNVAGGVKTGIVGHKRTVDKIDMTKALTGLLK